MDLSLLPTPKDKQAFMTTKPAKVTV
jgi:hypothetical protein